MALQKNMTLSGGAVVNNCYVRIQSVEAVQANEDSEWTLKVISNVYKDADDYKSNAREEFAYLYNPKTKQWSYIDVYDDNKEWIVLESNALYSRITS